MEDVKLKMEPREEDAPESHVLLTKDWKNICRTQCINAPSKMPVVWNISSIVRLGMDDYLSELPSCFLHPAPENSHQVREWNLFLGYLQKHKKVAIAKLDFFEFYILPPQEGSTLSHATVVYRKEESACVSKSEKIGGVDLKATIGAGGISTQQKEQTVRPSVKYTKNCTQSRQASPSEEAAVSNSNVIEDRLSPGYKFSEAVEGHIAQDLKTESNSRPRKTAGQCRSLERNYVQAHPSYLRTLGQAHSGWIFGAIAELIDNSRDAKATKLNISIDMMYSKIAGKDIPMLSVIDDGNGMTHKDILRMISFGHKQPEADDSERIGRFGIGFKGHPLLLGVGTEIKSVCKKLQYKFDSNPAKVKLTGAMRLGKDALILTQTANSRSIAFLSQSLNEGRDNLEIPIVSYRRIGQFMEVDTTVQDEASSKYNLKAIKEFSPFDKYLIGEKTGLFIGKSTGTQIYIWNLDEWGSDYCLQWEFGMSGGSSFHQGDIFIRSRRVRTRPGQMSQMVPLDYSLRSYLEVIFFDPRMKIYVQGAPIKSRPLAKSLNKTVVENGIIMGKQVQLTLGRSQIEWEQANCGIFLYWHGRLIEAYKRVGSMIHNGDNGRGIIGVIDVTELMNDGDGRVWVHSNKQGFQDCEAYAELEKWLGKKTDEYLDKYVDKIPLKRGNARYKPDHEWVQCDKCRKWRRLSSNFKGESLPPEWFCYMKPFNGRCDMPEEKVQHGVITVSEKRFGCSSKEDLSETFNLAGCSDSRQVEDRDVQLPNKRRRGPVRSCRNN